MSLAHKLEEKSRTDDVQISESVEFSGLLLSQPILDGLTKAGFKRPSPIQLKAIPLGRCGLDLIVQAKSGTGKTCVFSVIALEGLSLDADATQVLILAPTREIAAQISSVVSTIGSCLPDLRCCVFIGGMPLAQDKAMARHCHVATGTPGRIKQLVELGILKTDSIRLFVMDEADKLLDGSFTEDINWIYGKLPDNKQILALSATYPEVLANHLTRFMRNPTFVRLNIVDPALIGIRQYHLVVPDHPLPNKVFEAKMEAVVRLLSCVSFQQCLIFSNLQSRAQNLQTELEGRGWPTQCIAGCLEQKDRSLAMEQLRGYRCRVLISTDLTSRGIDADKINLVVNLDLPWDHETYLHRIGRAGRFGSYGAAISVVSKGSQEKQLWAVERKCKTNIPPLPDPIPANLATLPVTVCLSDVVTTETIITRAGTISPLRGQNGGGTSKFLADSDTPTIKGALTSEAPVTVISEAAPTPATKATPISETTPTSEAPPIPTTEAPPISEATPTTEDTSTSEAPSTLTSEATLVTKATPILNSEEIDEGGATQSLPLSPPQVSSQMADLVSGAGPGRENGHGGGAPGFLHAASAVPSPEPLAKDNSKQVVSLGTSLTQGCVSFHCRGIEGSPPLEDGGSGGLQYFGGSRSGRNMEEQEEETLGQTNKPSHLFVQSESSSFPSSPDQGHTMNKKHWDNGGSGSGGNHSVSCGSNDGATGRRWDPDAGPSDTDRGSMSSGIADSHAKMTSTKPKNNTEYKLNCRHTRSFALASFLTGLQTFSDLPSLGVKRDKKPTKTTGGASCNVDRRYQNGMADKSGHCNKGNSKQASAEGNLLNGNGVQGSGEAGRSDEEADALLGGSGSRKANVSLDVSDIGDDVSSKCVSVSGVCGHVSNICDGVSDMRIHVSEVEDGVSNAHVRVSNSSVGDGEECPEVVTSDLHQPARSEPSPTHQGQCPSSLGSLHLLWEKVKDSPLGTGHFSPCLEDWNHFQQQHTGKLLDVATVNEELICRTRLRLESMVANSDLATRDKRIFSKLLASNNELKQQMEKVRAERIANPDHVRNFLEDSEIKSVKTARVESNPKHHAVTNKGSAKYTNSHHKNHTPRTTGSASANWRDRGDSSSRHQDIRARGDSVDTRKNPQHSSSSKGGKSFDELLEEELDRKREPVDRKKNPHRKGKGVGGSRHRGEDDAGFRKDHSAHHHSRCIITQTGPEVVSVSDEDWEISVSNTARVGHDRDDVIGQGDRDRCEPGLGRQGASHVTPPTSRGGSDNPLVGPQQEGGEEDEGEMLDRIHQEMLRKRRARKGKPPVVLPSQQQQEKKEEKSIVEAVRDLELDAVVVEGEEEDKWQKDGRDTQCKQKDAGITVDGGWTALKSSATVTQVTDSREDVVVVDHVEGTGSAINISSGMLLWSAEQAGLKLKNVDVQEEPKESSLYCKRPAKADTEPGQSQFPKVVECAPPYGDFPAPGPPVTFVALEVKGRDLSSSDSDHLGVSLSSCSDISDLDSLDAEEPAAICNGRGTRMGVSPLQSPRIQGPNSKTLGHFCPISGPGPTSQSQYPQGTHSGKRKQKSSSSSLPSSSYYSWDHDSAQHRTKQPDRERGISNKAPHTSRHSQHRRTHPSCTPSHSRPPSKFKPQTCIDGWGKEESSLHHPPIYPYSLGPLHQARVGQQPPPTHPHPQGYSPPTILHNHDNASAYHLPYSSYPNYSAHAYTGHPEYPYHGHLHPYAGHPHHYPGYLNNPYPGHLSNLYPCHLSNPYPGHPHPGHLSNPYPGHLTYQAYPSHLGGSSVPWAGRSLNPMTSAQSQAEYIQLWAAMATSLNHRLHVD